VSSITNDVIFVFVRSLFFFFFKRTVHHLSNVSANMGLVTCIHSYCKVTPREKVIVESIIRAIREPFRRSFVGHDFYIGR
jgi:hypothetical protein